MTTGDDRVRAQSDSYRAQADSDRAGVDSVRAQDDSDRKDRRSLLRLLAYLVLAAAGGWGLWSVQGIATEAHDTASNFKKAEQREDVEEEQEQEDNCLVRNRAVLNGRERFQKFNENLTEIFQGGEIEDPVAAEEFRKRLFEGINFDPAVEDIDCNGDGKLNEKDYAP